MPRNLTDLMETAVSAAPPEKHHAGDITHLAERQQRRRTAMVAAGAALAVVVMAGVTVGLTQHHASSPEPVGRYKYDQTVDAASAVPASTLPGYRLEPWTVPSVQDLGPGRGKAPTYREVDSQGRLIVQDWPSGPDGARRSRIYDGPGLPPAPLKTPPSPGTNAGNPISWIPSIQEDGRLLWNRSAPVFGASKVGFQLTDLDGGRDLFVHTHFQVGRESVDGSGGWVSDGHVWFTVYDHATAEGGRVDSLYMATFSGTVTKVASKVAAADVADGVAVWVTTDGRVVTESAAGGPQHTVTVPFPAGCRMPSTQTIQSASGEQYLAVNRGVIALAEACGSAKSEIQEMVAFDLAGHLLVHVTGAYGVSPSLGQGTLVFQGLVAPAFKDFETLRYDLVSGSMARLGSGTSSQGNQAPGAAGRYVLWYDGKGGHVGEFTR